MKEPGDHAHSIDRFAIPDGSGDRFSGCAVIGLPFSSGHVLALRHVQGSSIGAAYTSVWHRDPEERWTFHQNVPPDEACPRYFGAAVHANTTSPIRIDWINAREFRVRVDAPGEIVWQVRLDVTPATRMMNLAATVLPDSWWQKRSVLSVMEMAARSILRTGRMNLTGYTPNGQVFTAMPRLIWSIAESSATVQGLDVGTPAPLPVQAMLADFRIPQRGLFAIFSSVLEG